jgi:hypothetical protein
MGSFMFSEPNDTKIFPLLDGPSFDELCGWSEMFSASNIDGNNIGKIVFS